MRNFEKDFDKWLTKQDYIIKQFYEPKLIHEGFGFVFRNLPESMQYGVFEDFFDINGIEIIITKYVNGTWRFDINQHEHEVMIKTRQQARRKSLIKAIEIYENNN